MRKTKRRVKRISLLIFTLLIIILAGFFSYKLFSSFNIKLSNNNSMVMPYITSNNIYDFEGKIKEKKIEMEYLKEASDSSIIIGKVKDGPIVYFSRENELDFQIASLQSILERLTIENRRPSLIDLRYKKPIVKL